MELGTLVPTFYRPVYENKVNRNFLGAKIYREAFTKQLEDELANARMHKANVNPIIRFMTESLYSLGGGRKDTDKKLYREDGVNKEVKPIFDWNPSKIEHLIKGYSGGTGAFTVDVLTTLMQMASPETVDADNIPYVNAFIKKYPEKKWKYIREYYELKDQFKNHESLMKTYKKNPEKLGEMLKDNEYRLMKKVIPKTENKLKGYKELFDMEKISLDKYLELRSSVIEKAIKTLENKKQDNTITSGLLRDYKEQLDIAKRSGSKVLIDKIQAKIDNLKDRAA